MLIVFPPRCLPARLWEEGQRNVWGEMENYMCLFQNPLCSFLLWHNLPHSSCHHSFFVFVLFFFSCLLNIVVQTLLCHLVSCSTSESLMSPVKQAPQKSPSDTEGLVNSVPARSHQVNCFLLLPEAGSFQSVWEMVWKRQRQGGTHELGAVWKVMRAGGKSVCSEQGMGSKLGLVNSSVRRLSAIERIAC